MKKLPRKIKQWADEAFEALEAAWVMLRDEYPQADVEEKLQIMRFAPAIAAMNRGIGDKKSIREAYDLIYARTAAELSNKEDGVPIPYSILFLLGYLDSHLSFGVLSEKKVDAVMEYLSQNYDIVYEP
jgi:hypothetical protein